MAAGPERVKSDALCRSSGVGGSLGRLRFSSLRALAVQDELQRAKTAPSRSLSRVTAADVLSV
jgi:hypothetical protein